MVDPDMQLDGVDRSHLNVIMNMDGFRVLLRIMEAEVAKFHTKLLNADPANEREVISAHLLAKSAAQFYAGVVNRLNEEKILFLNAPRTTDKPVDVTEGLIDIGEIADQLEDVPNLIGGE